MTQAGSKGKSILAERYELIREVGRGGMATVYLAEDRKYGRQVAAKVLKPELSAAIGGERFARETGLTILPDPTLIELDGERVLLLHGDTLCTDDVEYQKFRALARSEKWQRETLAKPYAERNALAHSIRAQSDSAKAIKTEEIMDVTPETVAHVFRAHAYPLMVHGHTHRPATHKHIVDGHTCARWVLADWHGRGEYLRNAENSWQRVPVTN